jgi:catechol 2,3-dioxygenase-like lactoylglutathione lyase family enzyme
MRLVVEAADFDEAVRFYRDVLGLPEKAAFEGDGDARVMILDAGRATLEIANRAQKRMIDEVEVGRQVAPRMRSHSKSATARRRPTSWSPQGPS